MATSVTFTDNSFIGEAAEPFIVDCVSANKTVEDGHIYLKTGINKKLYMPKLSVTGNLMQDYTGNPTESGDFGITERELPVFRQQVLLKWDPIEFRDFWPAYAPSPDQLLLTGQLPQETLTQMTNQLQLHISFQIAQCIWGGDRDASPALSYPYDRFNGIIPKLEAESGTIDVSGAVALSSSNIEEKLDDVYNLIPDACLRKQYMKIFVSTTTAKYMQAALNATSGKGPTFMTVNSLDDMMYNGVKVVALDEFPNDTIVAAESGPVETSNFYLGATNVQDLTTLEIDKVAAPSNEYYMKMIFALGTEVSKPDEVVLYKA